VPAAPGDGPEKEQMMSKGFKPVPVELLRWQCDQYVQAF